MHAACITSFGFPLTFGRDGRELRFSTLTPEGKRDICRDVRQVRRSSTEPFRHEWSFLGFRHTSTAADKKWWSCQVWATESIWFCLFWGVGLCHSRRWHSCWNQQALVCYLHPDLYIQIRAMRGVDEASNRDESKWSKWVQTSESSQEGTSNNGSCPISLTGPNPLRSSRTTSLWRFRRENAEGIGEGIGRDLDVI